MSNTTPDNNTSNILKKILGGSAVKGLTFLIKATYEVRSISHVAMQTPAKALYSTAQAVRQKCTPSNREF